MSGATAIAWLGLLGGLAIFTYGLNQTNESIKALTGGVFRRQLTRVARTPLGAAASGLLATLLAGSSSAVTVITVGFVNTGLLSLRQALEVILGASVGTTLTVQLISLKITTYAPIIIFVGVVWMLIERSRQRTRISPTLLGLGFIFYGMNRIVSAVHTLSALSWVHQSLGSLDSVPLLAGLLAFFATALIQNSATVIALAITFQIHHLVSLGVGLEMVLGANVGSTAASVYSALLGGSRSAKRTAFAYFLMKLSGAVVFSLGLTWFAWLVVHLDPHPARTLANAHSLFNLVIATVFLPFTPVLARLMERIMPDLVPVPLTRLNPSMIHRPTVALPQTRAEIGRMAELISQRLIQPLAPLLFHPDDDDERHLRQAEMEIDLLHDAVIHYLVDLGGAQRLNPDDRAEQIELFYLTNQLEHLSDTVIKVLDTLVKLSHREFEWTPHLTQRMHDLIASIESQYAAMAQAISDQDVATIRSLVQGVPEIRQQEGALRMYILTHGGEFERHALAAVLELSDDLAMLTGRIGDVGRAALGIV